MNSVKGGYLFMKGSVYFIIVWASETTIRSFITLSGWNCNANFLYAFLISSTINEKLINL